MCTANIRETAMRLLARREHSQKELMQKLSIRGFEAGAIQETLSLFEQKGWQSDARFAESYVAMRTRRGYGPLRIRQELQLRGIPDNLVAQYLSNDDRYWAALAEKARVKKFGSSVPTDFLERAKQMRFLQQRGFLNVHELCDIA